MTTKTKTVEKNECSKTRDKSDPYEIWTNGSWTWNVLKKYQKPSLEAKNPYARWFCLVVTPMTGPLGDMGDVYVSDIKSNAVRIK